MPFWRATSINSAPFSARTPCPLIVRFTSSAILDRHHLPIPRESLFEIVSELVDDGDGGHGRRISQRAERPAQHVLGKFAQQRDIFVPAAAVVEPLQDLAQPGGSFAAR